MKFNLKVLSKKVEVESKGKKKTFLRYFAPVKIVVKGEEEKGKQAKSLTVKFKQDVQLPKDARFFILTVDEAKGQIGCPFVYEVSEDKDGNKIFPVIWIRGYEDIKLLKSNDSISNYVDFETTDTEEVEIQ